ncbi:PLAC8-domain-containing protein [Meredithblackwellia eburnea MCA 4105]
MHQVYPSQPGIPAPAPQQAYQQPAPQLYPPAHHHQQQQQGQYEQKGVPQPIHQQPQGTPGMKLPGGSKNPLNKPVNAMGKREWSYGLFDCFDECGTCMMASFLPCFLYGQTRTKLEHMQRNNRPDPAGGSMCTGGCCLFYCLAPCYGAQIMLYMERNELVSRYGIEPSGTDCLVAFCCSCCAQIQHSREIEAEERSYV